MNPEIKRYLDEHGATYAPEALRRQLLEAGYDPAEVDTALQEWTAHGAGAQPDRADRRAFGWWAFGLHAGAPVALIALLVLLKGTSAIGMALLAAAVLAIPLLIGWLISSLIGRTLLPRGLVVALVVPAISALALGGGCFAIMNASIQPPPLHGSGHLEILAPRAFEGSVASTCYLTAGGVYGVDGQSIGTLDGKTVNVSLFWSGAAAVSGIPESLSIFMSTESETEPPESYSTIFSTHLEVDTAADRLSGTVQFEGLAAEPVGAPGVPLALPISGSFSWTCEET